MARKERRQLTEKEIHQIEAWSRVRLPIEMMADLLDMAKTDFQEQINKRDEVRRALAQGRASASTEVRQTLYLRAIGKKESTDPETGKVEPAIPVDFQALKFWCETQEGFKRAERMELSGPNGGPIENTKVSMEELKARVLALRKANDLTEDE